MNATLLCPGPSLASYRPVECVGAVVGVNRAAEAHACDVWAATDRPLIDRANPLGTPTLFTISATRDSLVRHRRPWPWLVITHCGIAGGVVENGRHPWTRYSATAALFYLAWIGAKRVDVWGCDWSGQDDWDGNNTEQTRTPARWDEEQEIWHWVIKQTDIEVIRHGLDG